MKSSNNPFSPPPTLEPPPLTSRFVHYAQMVAVICAPIHMTALALNLMAMCKLEGSYLTCVFVCGMLFMLVPGIAIGVVSTLDTSPK